MRIKNTILAIAHALKYYPENIHVNRLGTHLIEFMFGRMRKMSHFNDSINVLERSIIKEELAKEICARYGINNIIRGRCYANASGAPYTKDWCQ